MLSLGLDRKCTEAHGMEVETKAVGWETTQAHQCARFLNFPADKGKGENKGQFVLPFAVNEEKPLLGGANLLPAVDPQGFYLRGNGCG